MVYHSKISLMTNINQFPIAPTINDWTSHIFSEIGFPTQTKPVVETGKKSGKKFVWVRTESVFQYISAIIFHLEFWICFVEVFPVFTMQRDALSSSLLIFWTADVPLTLCMQLAGRDTRIVFRDNMASRRENLVFLCIVYDVPTSFWHNTHCSYFKIVISTAPTVGVREYHAVKACCTQCSCVKAHGGKGLDHTSQQDHCCYSECPHHVLCPGSY